MRDEVLLWAEGSGKVWALIQGWVEVPGWGKDRV